MTFERREAHFVADVLPMRLPVRLANKVAEFALNETDAGASAPAAPLPGSQAPGRRAGPRARARARRGAAERELPRLETGSRGG